MHRLLADADIFLTNTRPKALERLGLDYASLKEAYPKLIMANVNGFGEKGPKRIIRDLIRLHFGQAPALTLI